jgi:hypothetical protein
VEREGGRVEKVEEEKVGNEEEDGRIGLSESTT